MKTNLAKPKPVFQKRIFWDVNFELLDYDHKRAFVIERIFERGDVDDIRQCRRYYGDDLVKKTLLDAKYLPERKMHLAATMFDLSIKNFKCYTLKLSNQALYPY